MKDIVIIGASGCAKEILFLLEENNKIEKEWNILGFIDCNITRTDLKYPVLGDDDWLMNQTRELAVVIAVGNPALKKRLYEMYSKSDFLYFPTIISKHALVGTCGMGIGCIICNNCTLTVDVNLGDFVTVNIGTTICHESTIGDFTTLAPAVNVSGNVNIGEMCDIGVGSKIIQNITIGNEVVVGAGTVVIRDVDNECTVVGIPARKIKG